MNLTSSQQSLLALPLNSHIFLEGPAGTGKTTAGVERLLQLVQSGVSAGSVLVAAPQRTLAAAYYEALRRPQVGAGGAASVVTLGGLAQRMVELFWPLAAEPAGFAHPDQPPVFLTLETAQYYMARLARPLLDEGYFESVTLPRNRLYSQVLDNLNKSAVVGFPHTEISARLKAAWTGEISQARVYDDAQTCASRFREYCLAYNLLDFSLQFEVFRRYLWPTPLCRNLLQRTYRHLLVDNLEEDTPAVHDILAEWLPAFDSALLIYDHEAGYRRFLGADPETAYGLKGLCDTQLTFTEPVDSHPALLVLGEKLKNAISQAPSKAFYEPGMRVRPVLCYRTNRFFPQMLDWVTGEIQRLVQVEGIAPGEIAVLAPYLSDALRFALTDRLKRVGVAVRSHRPSRALREEPAAQCLLTLAMLAHPQWGIHPGRFDFAYAMMQAIHGLDLVRAQLLTEVLFRNRQGTPRLEPFDPIKPEMQARITHVLGQRYERLRIWLDDYTLRPPDEMDIFLSRLFGELLSQPGYGYHADYTAGEVAATLVESARKFRWAVGIVPEESGKPLGQEYLEMVQDGVVAAQYLEPWRTQSQDAVLLAPAYTFLMSNRPVDVQVWLDVGGMGWFERLDQPLTQPYVLSRQWPAQAHWTDIEEHETSRAALSRLAAGLLRRCRRKVVLGLSDLGEQGYEQTGPLLRAFNTVLRDEPLVEDSDEL